MADQGENENNKVMVPIDERLLKLPSSNLQKAHLIGSRCRACKEAFFPAREFCPNCTSPEIDEISLEKKGTLKTYTISRLVPPGSVMKEPYGVGIIELPGGAQVKAAITNCDLSSLSIGAKMEMEVLKIKEDKQGNDVFSFIFKSIED